ncbi:MAG: TIGR02270 family protein [Leptothrix ochracea]|uniref:TIGR02270 family protein n=1 Tax=Leptothrix ochracea TaxID=735331 RepID=UPI0034E2CE63
MAQHVEESAHLRHVRSVLVRSHHVQIHRLQRLDERIAAHLDGLAVAGDFGLKLCLEALETPSVGAVFTLAVRALELRDAGLLQRLFALVAAVPEAERGVFGALGWVSAQVLQGTIRDLLMSGDAVQRAAGLAACGMHRVDPGAALGAALADADERLRARALRVAGEVGRVDVLPQVVAACVADDAAEDEVLRFWAARSALLLGDRSAGVLAVLNELAEGSGAWSDAAAEWLLKVIEVDAARQHLRLWSERANEPGLAGAAARRRLIRRCGVLGDTHSIPWLIGQMQDLVASRLAGEAFTLITGADLARLDLERAPPDGASDGRFGGPNDDPNDDLVALDDDEGLPWPDAERVQGWWQAHQARFTTTSAAGQRFFMGEQPSPAQALKVLREGGQRQRMAAAQWVCLLTPGTKLFQTMAPVWRQQRWLAEMTTE